MITKTCDKCGLTEMGPPFSILTIERHRHRRELCVECHNAFEEFCDQQKRGCELAVDGWFQQT